METQSILARRISLCQNIWTTSYQTITLFDALNAIRTNVYKTRIDIIRDLYGKRDDVKYRAKKKQLPAYLFTGVPFDSRHKFDVCGYTSLLIIDVDHLDNANAIKTILKSDPFIISIWESPSGHGLKLLFYLEYTYESDMADSWIIHEHCAFPQVCDYISERYNICVDRTGGDITRLCFVSSDPDIHLKREFKPFQVSVTLNKNQIKHIRKKYLNGSNNVRRNITNLKNLSDLIISSSYGEPIAENYIKEINKNFSQIYLSITRVDYELTEQMIISLSELLEKLNNVELQEVYVMGYRKRLTEICKFIHYLKVIQRTNITPTS